MKRTCLFVMLIVLVPVLAQGQTTKPIDRLVDGRTNLIDSVMQLSVGAVNYQLRRGAGVDVPDINGMTPLHFAARGWWYNVNGQVIQQFLDAGHHGLPGQIMAVLLAAKANPNLVDKAGKAPLHYATVGLLPELVTQLLQAGADVNIQDADGNTPLLLAIAKGSEETATELVTAGADVRVKNKEGETALLLAAGNNDISAAVIKGLVDKGADVRERNAEGKTALVLARDRTEVVDVLVAAGADIHDLDSRSPADLLTYLHQRRPDLKTVENLIRTSTNVDYVGPEGMSALGYVVGGTMPGDENPLGGRVPIEIVRLLVAAKANVNAKDQDGNTPLLSYLIHNNHDDPAIATDIVACLVDAGTDVDLPNKSGQTALAFCYADDFEHTVAPIFLKILQKAKKANFTTGNVPPILWASWQGNVDIVKLLIQKGCPVNTRMINPVSDLSTPLICAAAAGKPEVIRLLLANKADIKALGEYSRLTALMAAANASSVESLRLLLAAKASVNALSRGGESALSIAVGTGNAEAVRVLLAAKADVTILGQGRQSLLYPPLVFPTPDSPAIVRLLIDAKINVNRVDAEGTTALMQAVDNLVLTTMLVEAKANVNARTPDGQSVLDFARQFGTPEVVAYLIKAGAK